jgi:catechol 2,3-dioxygenase-like lactoylglutathione lyase family enzyme
MCAVDSFHHTSLSVSDLDRSIGFYEGTIGLRVLMTQEKRGGYMALVTGYPDAHVRMAQLALDDHGHRLELFQYLQPIGRQSPPEPKDIGITHVCFVVRELQAMYERMRDAGVSTYSGPIELQSGVNKGGLCLYLRDPDGITIELFQPAAAPS